VSILLSFHSSSAVVVAIALDVVTLLSGPEKNATRLGLANACDAVCIALHRYIGNPTMAQSACQAITALGKGNAYNREALGTANGSELVTQVLQRYTPLLGVIVDALKCLITLTLAHSNTARFGVSACREVVKIIDRYIENQEIAELGPVAIRALIYRNTVNKNCVIELDGVALMTRVIDIWANNKKGTQARYEARDTLTWIKQSDSVCTLS